MTCIVLIFRTEGFQQIGVRQRLSLMVNGNGAGLWHLSSIFA